MPPFAVLQTPRAQRLGLADFRRSHFDPELPVVVAGAVDAWPALRSWSNDALVARSGDRVVPAYQMAGGQVRLDRRTGFRVRHLPLREFVRRLADDSAKDLYVRAELSRTLPELAPDVGVCPYVELGRPAGKNLWFAPRRTVSHCHFDLPDNLIAVIRGEKQFLLFAPSETRNLYPAPWLSSAPHLSRVDLQAPDLARFPRLRRAVAWQARVRAGDLLYVPQRFWHWALAVEQTVSVNHWFARPIAAALLRASNVYKRLRSLAI